MELVWSFKHIILKLLLTMIGPSISVAETNNSITDTNPPKINTIPWETQISLEITPPFITNDKHRAKQQSAAHHRTLLVVGGSFPNSQAANGLKRRDSVGGGGGSLLASQEPDVPALSSAEVETVENGMQDLISRWLKSARSGSKRDSLYFDDNNKSDNRRIQSATTTARPAYDQIPRPLLFDNEDFSLEIAATEPGADGQYVYGLS